MANNKKLKFFIKNYWNYYLRLEEEFLTALKYVEFDRDNYQTFSIEFLTVLLSVCSEIDVVGKVIANDFNKNFIPEKKDNTIYKWWYEIQNFLLLSEKVVNFRDIETIKPWYNFQIEQATNKKGNKYLRLEKSSNSKIPKWWNNYNSIKHNRTSLDVTKEKTNFKNANLKNLSQAFAGLYILEKSFIEKIATKEELKLIKKSSLFEKEAITTRRVESECFTISEEEVI